MHSHSSPTKAASFRLGMLVATPAAIESMAAAGQDPAELIARHRSGDWGDLGAEDRASNDLAVLAGGRVLSAYQLSNGTRLWIITEADRSATTILLPEDY